ncbi:MAG TPA: phospholipase D-like domain-containing protein, partial [Pyrinomonadaceae bacterium]|nr:phospholipase D-like domain-containing protein [Pyrinomonadaceae bacterium]
YLRFILMEKPPTDEIKKTLTKNRDCIISYGAVLGEMYTFKDGEPVARRRIKDFELDKWFLKEEHFRKANEGFVFFIHTKFLLIDPLSDDPLVCSGSANFSPNSLLQNDENMLLIRGDTRVADIYLSEFDRIFRHFYFRDVANEIEARGDKATGAFLDETSKWTDSYFRPNAFKTRRREMFFADSRESWVDNASKPEEKKPAKGGGKKSTKKASTKAKAAKKR